VSALNVAYVRPTQASVLGEIVLVPALSLTEVPDALSNSRANVCTCHTFSMDVSFWLYFAKWLHSHVLFFGWIGNREFWAGVSLSCLDCVHCSIADALNYKGFEKQRFGFNKVEGAYELVQWILFLVWWSVPGPSRSAPADPFCINLPRGKSRNPLT